MNITKGKYTILEYPMLKLPNVHKVRVLKVYENPKLGRIVQYRYNWPFPITSEVTEKEFTSWIAKETQ